MSNAERLDRLRAGLELPLLVTGPYNVAYLTGFLSSNAAVLVAPDAATLFADARYSAAGRQVADVDFVETGRVLLGDLATRLRGRVGFEAAHISYAGHELLGSAGLELVPISRRVENLRAIKEPAEIETLKRASALADVALTRLLGEAWVGRTEHELAQRLRMIVLEEGGDDVAFDVIVGSGANGAKPHSRPGERRVVKGDLVIVDFGVLLDGYRSDLTRTVEIGPVDAQSSEILEVCERAYSASLADIRPGMSGVQADAVARDLIAEAGFGDNFGHALGHGIGLEVHEAPTISRLSNDEVAASQVLMIEPGIYVEGHAGARIEDMCLVGPDGLERVTTLPARVSAS